MSQLPPRPVAYDCKFFLGDRPCSWHKKEGALCECEHYAPIHGDIAIIKLDAIGDVLRTTCLLPAIERAWPDMRISWVTRPEAVPLLENNPYIAEIVPYGAEALLHLSTRRFDRVVNLDAGKTSAALAALADAEEKIGYVTSERGYVVGTNDAAEEWLRMGIFDDLKRTNRRSHQEIMSSILGLPNDGLRYVLELTEDEQSWGRRYLRDLGMKLGRRIVGIHTGGGGRWRLKQWTEEGFLGLISRLGRDTENQVQILLLGGPLERALNRRIGELVSIPVFDAGCDNTLRNFAALIDCCSVVVSGDSLAMHAALARRRRVVVLFGPTSSSEIELFGLGEKVIPDLNCLCCYKKDCDFVPNCMESISVDMVHQAILRQLAAADDRMPATT